MEKRITDLSEQTDKRLSELQDGYDDIIEQAKKATTFLAQQIETLQGFISGYSFESESEEIQFFKHVNPDYYSKYIYYHHIWHIEGIRRHGIGISIQQRLLKDELLQMERFFKQNLDLVDYYYNDDTYRDVEYFTRSAYDPNHYVDEYSLFIHCSNCTFHSYKVAQILAYGSLQSYLVQALDELSNHSQLPVESSPGKAAVTWTAPKAALIELAYALQSSGVFNYGRTDVKQVVTILEISFNIKLGNFYRVFQGQRIRKKSRTSFLDELKENLIKRMDESDLNPKVN